MKVKRETKIIISSLLIFVLLLGYALFFEDLSKILKETKQKLSVFAQEIPLYFIPFFPERIKYLISEIERSIGEMEDISSDFVKLAQNCSCSNLQSVCVQTADGCFPSGVFGDVCGESKYKVEQKKGEFYIKKEQLRRLKYLLDREIEIGLVDYKENLAGEDKENLEEKLNSISKKLSSLNEKLDGTKETLYSQCNGICTGSCNDLKSLSINACFGITGEQKPLSLKVEAGVTMEDIKIGRIGIKELNFNLPEKITLPALPKIPKMSFSIPVKISFPDVLPNLDGGFKLDLSRNDIELLSPLLKTPVLSENFSFSCSPQSENKGSYVFGDKNYDQNRYYIEAQWYMETFAFLSEQCQTLRGMQISKSSVPHEIEFKKCFDIKNVHNKIRSACYEGSELGAPICGEIGTNFYCLQKSRKIQQECENIFKAQKKEVPKSCIIKEYCYYDTSNINRNDMNNIFCRQNSPDCIGYSRGTGYKYVFKKDVEEAVNTLKGECERIKELRIKNNDAAPMPNPCKFLPIFTGDFPQPKEYNYDPKYPLTGSNQVVFDHPETIPGCPAYRFSSPVISFPKIIIPDIRLPKINFCPFFAVRLPNIIFEDLELPNLNLCDMGACFDFFANFKFRTPSLTLPQAFLDLPLGNINANIDGKPVNISLPSISIRGPNFPVIAFNITNLFDLKNILNLQLDVPEIQIPAPKMYFKFVGFDIDFMGIILGLILRQWPSFQACASINLGCETFSVPDIIFSWPKFPNIPQIPICSKVVNFCQDMKNKIGSIVNNNISQIEEFFNGKVLGEIQNKIDLAATAVNERIKEKLNGQMDKLIQEIRDHVAKNSKIGQDGKLKIQPFEYTLYVDIDEIDMQGLINFPREINIQWPDYVKKIAINAQNIGDIGYDVPKIPLSAMSWSKKIDIKIPGTQELNIRVSTGGKGNSFSCKSEKAIGGNPCNNQINKVKSVQPDLKEAKEEIDKDFKEVFNLLK
jgi:hypothetical protein